MASAILDKPLGEAKHPAPYGDLQAEEQAEIYAQAGVSFYWILDPRAELLETFISNADAWMVGKTFDRGMEVKAVPSDAISFPLSMLWPLPAAGELKKDDE